MGLETRFKHYTLIGILSFILTAPAMATPGEPVIVVTPTGGIVCVDTGGGVVVCQ